MFGLLVLAAGVVLLGFSAARLRPAYHVYRGETQDIVEVERMDGPVELEGTATTVDRTLSAPITGTECLAYEYEVQEYKSSGKSSSWRTVDQGSAAVPFRLEDRTASVVVDAVGAEPVLSTDWRTKVQGGEPEPEPVAEFLAAHADLDSQNRSVDIGITELATGNDRRYYERRLHPDEDAYVLGQTTYDVDARETMRDVSAVVQDGPETPAFVVADEGQEDTAWQLVTDESGWLLLALVLVGFGLFATAPRVLSLAGI